MYLENLRVFTPARIIDGSNKTTTLGLRHGTGIKMLILAFTISLLIYPKMGWVKRFIRMKSHFFSEIDRTSSLVRNPTYPDRFQVLRNSVHTGRFEF